MLRLIEDDRIPSLECQYVHEDATYPPVAITEGVYELELIMDPAQELVKAFILMRSFIEILEELGHSRLNI